MDDSEKLKALGPLVLEIPERLVGAIERVSTVQALIDRGLQRSKALKELVSERADDLLQEIKELETVMDDGRNEIAGASTEVALELAEAQSSLSDKQESLQGTYDEVKSKLDDLGSKIQTSLEEIKSRQEESKSSLDSLTESANQKAEELKAGVESAVEQVDAFKDAAQAIAEECSTQIDGVAEALDTHQESLGGAVEDVSGVMADVGANFEGSIQEVYSSVLAEGTDAAVNKLQEVVSDEMKSMIDDIVEGLTNEFDELTKKLTESDEESKVLREALEPLIEDLMEKFEPMEALCEAVEEVKDKLAVL